MKTETPWGVWEPISLAEMVAVMAGCPAPWWIAGGYAIEAFVGRSFREHADIDVSLLRRDWPAVQEHLQAWELHAADPPGTLRPWQPGEALPPRVHDIWARGGPTDSWRFQLMVDEGDGEDWVYRRNGRVRRPLDEMTFERAGVRFLQPEVQLLFKAKGLRPKDEMDFEAVLPLLGPQQRAWLAEGLQAEFGSGHPWLARL